MNILVLGGGGREHALVWAFSQNPKCDALFAAPGNAGIAAIAECVELDPCDSERVVEFCDAQSIDFVVVGPEAPLVAGVADALRDAGILTFGPSAAAAELEASKAFTKEICAAVGAPTAAHATFDDLASAEAYLAEAGAPIVVKADGLAAGKGVTVAETMEEAQAALTQLFAEPGARVVLEEMLRGEEASLFVLADGDTILPIGSAQDHKRIGEGDRGPNTGGMGAYGPAPVLTPGIEARAIAEIVAPVVAEMARRGCPYQGVLYAGLMIEDGVPRLIEFNARFGDPEAQVLVMRLGAQLLDLCLATARGELAETSVTWADDHALCVVMAARGYPGSYASGEAIGGLDTAEEPGVRVFHAGTKRVDGTIRSAGGRVLSITGRAPTLAAARDRAYEAVDRIHWPGGVCRRDIGWRALGKDAG
ncbi:MAG: phosphoribosylamine--glycine ligase [Pseudomonadota bacterium]